MRTHQQPFTPILLPAPECARLLGIGERTFHELRNEDPTFPKPIALGGRARCLRWRVADLEAYTAQHPTAQRSGEPIGPATRRAAQGAAA